MKVQAVEQMQVVGVGEQELAVDARDVSDQSVAPACGVDAAQHVAAQAGAGHCGEHVGGIAHQDSDVQRPRRVGHRDEGRRLCVGLGDVLTPRPGPIAVLDRRRVEIGAFAKQLLKGIRHRWPPWSGA
jgi:hypothetical protein